MKPAPANTGQQIAASPWAVLGEAPLFHAAWLFAAGICMARALWLRPTVLLVALAAIALLCAVAAFKARRVAWLPLALLWLLLGAWCAEMEPHPVPEPGLLQLSDGLLRTVEGTVTDAGPIRDETQQREDGSSSVAALQRIDLHLSSIEIVNDTQDAQQAIDGAIRLTVRWPAEAARSRPAPIACGERVRAVVRLLPPEMYHDPGAWSHADYLLDQGITSIASPTADNVESLGAAQPRPLRCMFTAAQHASSARLLGLSRAARHWPAVLRIGQDDAIMLAAIATGDRTFLTHPLRAGFERTGSFHMLVVSGLHLAIVSGWILWTARKMRMPRVPATILTIAASFAYALFTGFATPVQRSLWMVVLYLVARLVYRERNALNTIGFAALCLLAASPRGLFDSSLQMTLLAVISIGGIAVPLLGATIHPYLTATHNLRRVTMDTKIAPRIAQFRVTLRMFAERLQRLTNHRIAWNAFPAAARIVLSAGELLLVTVVMEFAMALPMAVYFHRITIFALPVNLFILPLLLLLLPAALVTLLALVLWQPLAALPAALAALLLHIGAGLVHLSGSFTWSDVRIPAPLLWQSGTFCVLLAAAIVLAHKGGRWPHRAVWAVLAAAALIAVAPRPTQHPQDALLVEAIDVGQGDSLLLITPEGKTLLVDGGGLGGGLRQAPQEFDLGEEVVSPALWARGIRHLDAVALSHAHSDHMGGLPAVLRNFHPAELWVGNNPRFPAYNQLLAEAAALHVRLRTLSAGDTFALGSMKVNVFAPLPTYQPGEQPSNNDSLVMRAAFGATSVLLEGDAEAPIEDGMLAEPGLASTLLKVGHHGSISSTRPEFLARVAPQWAVISCGPHNRYGHPRLEVLEELQAAHVRVFRTDWNGAVCFRLNKKSVVPEPGCGASSGP